MQLARVSELKAIGCPPIYNSELVDVEDIIIEDAGIPVSSRSIVEKAIEKIKTMTDEEIIRRVFSSVVS